MEGLLRVRLQSPAEIYHLDISRRNFEISHRVFARMMFVEARLDLEPQQYFSRLTLITNSRYEAFSMFWSQDFTSHKYSIEGNKS